MIKQDFVKRKNSVNHENSVNPVDVRVPGRAPRWIVPSVKVGLVIADAVIVALSFILAFYVREGAPVFADGSECFGSQQFQLVFRCKRTKPNVVACNRIILCAGNEPQRLVIE